MKEASFEVQVPDYTSSVEEYHRAQLAPRSELPKLSEEEREIARKFKISEEEYARGVLAAVYGRERKMARARRLGEAIQEILKGLGDDDRLLSVLSDVDRLRWIVKIQTREGVHNVAVPVELAADVIDWGLREKIDELRSRVVSGLGRDKLREKPTSG